MLIVKCSKNFNTSNPISHEINKTINDSKKSIEETEPTGEGSKDKEAEKATESNKNNSDNTSKPSSGSNNSNSGSSSSTEKPAHTNNWVNVTKTVNHPAETHQEDVYEDRQVKVKDAWDEQVKTGTAQECRQCGFRTTDGDAMTEHMLENGHSCHTVYTYETAITMPYTKLRE